jgi:hypothetical protein
MPTDAAAIARRCSETALCRRLRPTRYPQGGSTKKFELRQGQPAANYPQTSPKGSPSGERSASCQGVNSAGRDTVSLGRRPSVGSATGYIEVSHATFNRLSPSISPRSPLRWQGYCFLQNSIAPLGPLSARSSIMIPSALCLLSALSRSPPAWDSQSPFI